jgi:uncharacterized protein
LKRIERGEEAVKALGVSKVRLRDNFPVARIQVPKADFMLILESKELTQKLKELGYAHVALDLEELKRD